MHQHMLYFQGKNIFTTVEAKNFMDLSVWFVVKNGSPSILLVNLACEQHNAPIWFCKKKKIDEICCSKQWKVN